MSIEKKSLENHDGQWAAVYVESGVIKKVTYAEGKEAAETLLLHNFTDALKKLIKVHPVTVLEF